MLENLRNAIIEIDEKYFERNERDFSYEVYHQLRKRKLPKNVEVTCETHKNRFSYNDAILEDSLIKKWFFSDEVNENRRIHRYPDLLIHEYNNRNQQLLAVEFKKDFTPASIKRDLAKLIVYCKGRLKYKNAVLIVVNPRRGNIIEIPNVRELLKKYPMVEIWIVKYKKIKVYNSTTI